MIFDVIPYDKTLTHPNGDGKEFLEFIKKNDGKLCTLELKVVRSSKSNPQNRYFRGIIVKNFKKALFDAGYQSFSDDEYFQILKNRFFSYKKGKETFFHSTSNSDWNTEEWENKMTEIRNWVQDKLNYMIPLPNEG